MVACACDHDIKTDLMVHSYHLGCGPGNSVRQLYRNNSGSSASQVTDTPALSIHHDIVRWRGAPDDATPRPVKRQGNALTTEHALVVTCSHCSEGRRCPVRSRIGLQINSRQQLVRCGPDTR